MRYVAPDQTFFEQITQRSSNREHDSRWLVLVALSSALLLAALELTVVVTILPIAATELGAGSDYSWVVSIYVLVSSVAMPLLGRMADIHGRKRVLLVGILLFLVGSLGCGVSETMQHLVIFRAVQGLGAGAIHPTTMTLAGDLYSGRTRVQIQGLFSGIYGFAGITGPVVGGFIAKLSWRWAFYINIPLGLIAAPICEVSLRERVVQARHTVDFYGSILLAVALTSMLLGTAEREVLQIVLGILVLLLFFVAERRAPHPMFPLQVFRSRIVIVSNIVGAFSGATMLTTITFIPLFVERVLQLSPGAAGKAIMPMMLAWPIANILAAQFVRLVSELTVIRLGVGLSLAGAVGLAHFGLSGCSVTILQVASGLTGLGLGLANPVLMLVVQSATSWQTRGVATACVLFFRSVAGAIAVNILGHVAVAPPLNNSLAQVFTAIACLAGLSFIMTWALSPTLRSAKPK